MLFRMPPSPLRVAVVAAAATVVPMGSGAAGLGAAVSTPALGQPLDVVVPWRVGVDEPALPGCASAEVALGERVLPAGLVRTIVEPSSAELVRIRVRSAQPVDEPVVTLNVAAGCEARVSRRYVLLVDAPAFALAAASVASPVPAAAVPAVEPATGPFDAAAHAASGSNGVVPAMAGSGAQAAFDGAGRSTPAKPVRAMRPAAVTRKSSPAGSGRRSAARTTETRTAARRAPSRVATAGTPRLRLEAATEPVYAMSLRSAEAQAVDEALAAVAQAASAARGAASAAAASAARIGALEREVQQLRSELQNERAAAALLRAQLARGDEPGRWMLPLVALAVGLAAVALWLAWRLTRLQRQRQNGWQQAAPTTDSAIGSGRPSRLPAPPVVSELAAPPSEPLPPARPLPAWPPAAPSAEVESTLSGYVTPVRAASGPAPELAARQAPQLPSAPGQPAAPSAKPPAAATTEPLAAPHSGAAQAPRDVSVEELIDLEQQAEFFVVLGQDEAAVDLLVEHLRHTGGGSPLPFLKLLEIFGRRGNRDAYERMRARFNRRFNAYAPEWGADLSHGRVLEDYPEVLPRLQAAWPRPLDAMAELEALLFRRSRGELFDLPAYREVLFLYSLARDLLDHEAVPSGSVDLLLPMADAQDPAYAAYMGSMGPRRPQPDRGRDSGPDSGPMTLPLNEERATAPIDLDLSHPGRVPSIFDPLVDAPARPH
jgi:hypothetical protein